MMLSAKGMPSRCSRELNQLEHVNDNDLCQAFVAHTVFIHSDAAAVLTHTQHEYFAVRQLSKILMSNEAKGHARIDFANISATRRSLDKQSIAAGS